MPKEVLHEEPLGRLDPKVPSVLGFCAGKLQIYGAPQSDIFSGAKAAFGFPD